MNALIGAEKIVFSYGGKQVLDGISIRVRHGEVLAILGPNGSGKTTLMKILLGLLKPDSGIIKMEGLNLAHLTRKELARKMAYVPQNHREAFGYTVDDIVLMGRMPHLSFFGRYSCRDMKIAAESLEKMSVGHLHDRPYTEISGGERQLVLIARAIAQEAKIIVMDEPSSSLDFGNQMRLLATVKRLAGEEYTFIFTTHHPNHALLVADRVVMMSRGAKISEGSPENVITDEKIRSLYDLDESLMPSGTITASAFGTLCA